MNLFIPDHPRLSTEVVALYVDARGPYPKLVHEWYDEERNAMTYRGSKAVIAHPPCGPWANLAHLKKNAQDIALAPHAVAVVQRVGGVLEHPKGSKLWDACGLPKPVRPYLHFGRELLVSETDADCGGFSIEVAQCDWGHPARKKTWLYIVGTFPYLLPSLPEPKKPTHWASGGRTKSSRKGSPVPPGIKVCSEQQRRRTPVDFAEWLLSIATKCIPYDRR